MSVDIINILEYDVGKAPKTVLSIPAYPLPSRRSRLPLLADGDHLSRRKDSLRSRSNVLLLRSIRRRRQLDSLTSTAPDDVISLEDQNNDGDRLEPSQASRVSAEWSGATGGPPAEVVLRLHPAPPSTARVNVTSSNTSGSGVVVRAEEALIVAFVLLLWVAAIALFFNRWGKIRFVYKLMLEPYQPKFQQQHRQSCGLVDNSVSIAPHHRASLSRGCVSYDYGASFPAYQPCAYLSHRTRQNSVFVSNMGGMALIPESPPRRSRSAADIPALITPGDISSHPTPRSSRAASLHSAVDFRVYVPSPRASRASSLHNSVDMAAGSVQVHVRGSVTNIDRPRSPRRLTVTNV